MTNPDLNGLFDNWQKGSVLLVTFNGGAAQGHLQSIIDGILTLSGPNLTVFVNGVELTIPGPININVEDITSVSFVAPV